MEVRMYIICIDEVYRNKDRLEVKLYIQKFKIIEGKYFNQLIKERK